MTDQESRKVLVTGGSGFIGTHVVDALIREGVVVLNLDTLPPPEEAQHPHWRQCDILDVASLKERVDEFRPAEVVHLAARTDMGGETVEDYATNSEGTANVLQVLESSESVERVVFTSTQFVVGPGRPPVNDEDYRPHTIYGESKVEAERLVQRTRSHYAWTIIRPTNIWGPLHPRYTDEFWRVLKRGLYFHPGRTPVVRSYGYVKNVVYQIQCILRSPHSQVDRQVYYLGDEPIDLLDWVDAFSIALADRPARVVPRPMFRLVALAGDVAVGLGINAPIFSSRYRSMTEDYWTPTDRTLTEFGPPPYSLQEGVDETVEWLRGQGSFWE